MLKRLLIFFVVHLLVITLVINTYSEASESPWDVRSMRSGQTILVLKTGNVTYGDTLMLVLENKNGKLSNDLEVVNEHDLLSKLIETSASKDKPIIVKDNQNKIIGVISQSDLLKAVIEGGDGE